MAVASGAVDRRTQRAYALSTGTSRPIADRSGYFTTGIHKLLKRRHLNVPPTPRPLPPGPGDALVAELIRPYAQKQLGLKQDRRPVWAEL